MPLRLPSSPDAAAVAPDIDGDDETLTCASMSGVRSFASSALSDAHFDAVVVVGRLL